MHFSLLLLLGLFFFSGGDSCFVFGLVWGFFPLVLKSILNECCFEKQNYVQVSRTSNQQQLKESKHGQAEEGDHSSRSQFVREIMFEEIKTWCRTAQGCFSCTMHMLMLYLLLFCCNVYLAASKHMEI